VDDEYAGLLKLKSCFDLIPGSARLLAWQHLLRLDLTSKHAPTMSAVAMTNTVPEGAA